MAYTVADIIKDIANTSSNTEKKLILMKHRNVMQLTDILKFIYDPYNKTCISEKKFNAALERNQPGSFDDGVIYSIRSLMQYLSANRTGSNTDCDVVARHYLYYMKWHPDNAWMVKAIATQNLKIGVSTTTLNAVYGKNFIPTVNPMLGKDIDSVNIDRIKWPVIVTEKLDGVRRVSFVDSDVRIYSRSGHLDSGLLEIEKELSLLPAGYVYDGELEAIGSFKDNIALRQATTSIANSNGIRSGLKLRLFDMIPIDEFKEGTSLYGALVRKNMLHDTLQQVGTHHLLEYIEEIPIITVTDSMPEVIEIAERMWSEGKEGVMLNTVSGLYKAGKRSKDLLKVKSTITVILEIVGIEEGKGKYKGTTGAFITTYKGTELRVGSGLTDVQRELAWMHKEELIGKWIEVETFGESKNAGGTVSLNCPIFKRYIADED